MKFSVLLPTRNRLDLLQYAVQTVLSQDYEDWEIIISDNFSDEDIRGYVDSLNDTRIRYSRTDRFVSVTENWNNALNPATGDYMIMLGDDDGLTRGYFSKMAQLISTNEQPDLIYTDAYLFAYPGALPEYPATGVLRHGYNTYFPSREPFLIDRNDAVNIVRRGLGLEIPIFYNMQLSLIRMEFIRSLAAKGAFFQSPFPDYYATIVSFLKAQRILIYQQPVAVIGVSRKSFGYYFFSNRQAEGEKFLNNVTEQRQSRLQSILLPGSVEYTCRLIAMDTVYENFAEELQNEEMTVAYSKYRYGQIRSNIAEYYAARTVPRDEFKQFRRLLSREEWLRYYIPFSILYSLLGLVSNQKRQMLKKSVFALLRKLHLRPETQETRWKPIEAQTLLDVYENFSPNLPENSVILDK